MRPANIELIGDQLAIRWEGGGESFISLAVLRRHCPCAGCKGEMDVMGNVYTGTQKPLSPESFHLVRLARIGGYAIQPVWADGHNAGIYSYDYLRHLGELSEG